MISKLGIAVTISKGFLRLAKLIGLMGGWFMASVLAPPRKKCPYFLRNMPVVQKSKNCCARHEDSLGVFLRSIYEVVGSEPSLVADAGKITRDAGKAKNRDLTAQYQYLFIYMSTEVVVFSLMLYLLEMYTVVNKEGGITKDFFTFCDEFRRKNYFDDKDWMSITLGLIKYLSPSVDMPSVDNSFDTTECSSYKCDEDAGTARILTFIKRLRSSGDDICIDKLREKIEQEVAITKATTVEAFVNIVTIIRDKKRWLESSKIENAKLNMELLDYVLNKLLTFADRVYSLATQRIHWLQAGLLAFIEGEETLGDSASFFFKASVKELEGDLRGTANGCIDASLRLLKLFEAEILSSHPS